MSAFGGSRETEVLIVGAGPTGLTLACELARRGVCVRVVDQARHVPAISRATDIHSRTLELFSQLGVVESFLDAGRKVRAFNSFPEGQASSRIQLDRLDSPYPFTVSVLQNDTERLLAGHLLGLGVGIERGVRLVGMAMDASGVDATLVHDDDTRMERVRCGWIAGCDGISSTVRSLAGIAYQGITYALDYLVADADIPWGLAHDEVHLFTSDEGFANVVPLPNGAHRGRVLCDVSRSDVRPTTPALARELFARRTRGIGRAHQISAVSRFRIQCRLAARFRWGRALLLGDAAHTCSPLLGQGMNLGIQDAFNLGWKLAHARRREARADALLDSYESERRSVNRNVLLCTNALHVASTVRARSARLALDSMGRALASTASGQHAAALLCSEIGTRYLPSTFVQDGDRKLDRWSLWSRTALRWSGVALLTPAPGERAPDAVIGTRGKRLMKEFDGRFVVLMFLGASPSAHVYERAARLVEQVRRQSAGEASIRVLTIGASARLPELVDDELGHAHARYGAGAVYVVRPDGHIGFRSRSADEQPLLRYLRASLA